MLHDDYFSDIMGLADQLCQAKSNLNSTKTKITTLDGQVFIEENGRREVQGERCTGFVVDTQPDMNLSLIVSPWLFLGSQDVAADAELLRCRWLYTLALNI